MFQRPLLTTGISTTFINDRYFNNLYWRQVFQQPLLTTGISTTFINDRYFNDLYWRQVFQQPLLTTGISTTFINDRYFNNTLKANKWRTRSRLGRLSKRQVYSYGPIQLWPYVVIADVVMTLGRTQGTRARSIVVIIIYYWQDSRDWGSQHISYY